MSVVLKVVPSEPESAAYGTRRGRRSRARGGHLRLVGRPVTIRCADCGRAGRCGHVGRQARVESGEPIVEMVPVEPLVWPARPERIRRPRLAVAPGVSPSVLRITRRGRLLLSTLVAIVLAVMLVEVLGAVEPLARQVLPASAAGIAAQPVEQLRVIKVLPGQTLWDIARQEAPDRDPRDVVIEVRDANGLSDSRVFAGQELAIPAL